MKTSLAPSKTSEASDVRWIFGVLSLQKIPQAGERSGTKLNAYGTNFVRRRWPFLEKLYGANGAKSRGQNKITKLHSRSIPA